MPIRTLPPQLINQIAAGEVVERPASAVKELVENAFDAQASRVDIDVEQGGLRLFRVRDNGMGIARDELALALSRHATSKIASLDDLENVSTMGFRGEALPSISSVSRLTLTSRQRDAADAWQVSTDGAETEFDIRPAAHPPGSTVEVRDIFYNTPARRKFLRSEKTEFQHIETLIRRMALARLDVGLSLSHNQRSILQLKPTQSQSDIDQRLTALLGGDFLEQSLPVDFSAAGLRLHGWVGLPTFSRSQADHQFFYVNGRLVKDKLVSQSTFDAQNSAYKAAESQARAARAQLDVARNQAAYSQLRAPRDGVIATRQAEAGQVVAAGQTIFTLAANDGREIAISLPEGRIREFVVGQPVMVELWNAPGVRLPGQIREISPAADAQTRTYAARVKLVGDAAKAVELGQSARVYVQDTGVAAALSLPLSAIQRGPNKATAVWVVDPQTGRVKSTPVQLGRYGETDVPVLGGVNAGDWVVGAGGHLLREGQPVTPVDRDNRPLLSKKIAVAAAPKAN